MKYTEDFIQWQSPDGVDAITVLYRKYPSAGDVFTALLKLMKDGNACSCTQSDLADVVGRSRITVIRALRFLEDHGYIFTLKTGRENAYTLSPKIVWKGKSGERKLHANIECNILLRLEPQSKVIKDHAIIDRDEK